MSFRQLCAMFLITIEVILALIPILLSLAFWTAVCIGLCILLDDPAFTATIVVVGIIGTLMTIATIVLAMKD